MREIDPEKPFHILPIYLPKQDPLEEAVRKNTPYQRQFKNDFGASIPHLIKRGGLIALPFLSLYQPFGRAVSLFSDTTRSISCLGDLAASTDKKEICVGLVKTTFAVTALTTSIFFYPASMLLTTSYDAAASGVQSVRHLVRQDYHKALSHGAQCLSSSLYLGLLCTGSVHLLVLSSSVQILYGLYHATDEFKKGHKLEGVAHVAMTAIRCHQFKSQFGLLGYTRQDLEGVLLPLRRITKGMVATTASGLAGGVAIAAIAPTAPATPTAAVQQTLPLPKAGDKPVVYHSDQDKLLKNTQLECIRNAKKSVFLMTYTLSDLDIIQALNLKVQQGIPVTVIMDKDHTGPLKMYGNPQIKLLTRTAGEGRYHHKILVIDQALTWLGSANFSSDALTTQSNTMTIVHNEELATYLHQEIDVMQGLKKREKNIPPVVNVGGQKVELLFFPNVPEQQALASPEKFLNTQGKQRLLDLINQSQTHLRLYICVWTDMDLAKAVIEAKKRGVHVEVMIWGVMDSLQVVNQFAQAGIPVLNKQHLPLMHNKMMVVDDSIFVNGSANWSKSWFTRNDESFLVLHDMEQKQKEYLDQYWKQLEAK